MPERTNPVQFDHTAGPKKWCLADIIDFEFLLEQDQDAKASDLSKREDAIRGQIESSGDRTRPNRGGLFHRWLEIRRAQSPDIERLPGEVLMAAWRVVLKVIMVMGSILGIAAAAQLLRYDGQQPVNVAAYLGWLILFQLALVGVAIFTVVLRKYGRFSVESSLILSAVHNLWIRVGARVAQHADSKTSAGTRAKVAAFIGTTASHKTIYGNVAIWQFASSLQLFGVCFNFAALVTTVALVVFSDRAFGWQSAVNFSGEQIHQLTQTLALPWSWALPETVPTLDQIEGSKIVLKDGIKQLATTDLVSWWPFLCISLAIYGLLPRLALWFITMFSSRRALQTLSFNHASCDRLYERLRRPTLETMGEPSEPNRPAGTADDDQLQLSGSKQPDGDSIDVAIALMSDELSGQVKPEVFFKLVHDRFLLNISKTVAWSDDASGVAAAFKELETVNWNNKCPAVILLEEAWVPPIAEKIQGVRLLRSQLGANAKLIIALLGRPTPGNPLTPAKSADQSVWDRQFRSLGDPQLRVESLIANE